MDQLLKTKKEYRDSRYIYQNELDKSHFYYGMAHGDSKDLHRRTISDNVLLYKAFVFPKNLKYDRCQCSLTSMVYNFFNKKSIGTPTHTRTGTILKANINQKNLINQILENLENLNYIHPLRATFRVLVQHIGN